MDITFLVPCKDLAGGLKVVGAYGNALVRRGHRVTIVYPERKRGFKTELKMKLRRKFLHEEDHLDRFRGKLLKVPEISEAYIPDGDVLIATAWQTAEWAKGFPERCGRKFYLIQHYETWSGDPSQVDATFHYPFQKIVISKWLYDVVKERMAHTNGATLASASGNGNGNGNGNGHALSVIPNGKDFFLSESIGDGLNRKYDIGMLYSRVNFKRSADGLEAIRLVQQKHPELKVVLFGHEAPKEALPLHTDFFRRPAQDKIRELYLSTRVWISSSVLEGFCLPALEAISLGCAVVATNSKGIEDIISDGQEGYLVKPEDPQALADKILQVLENKNLEKQLQIAGLRKSENFSWEKSTDRMEALFQRGE